MALELDRIRIFDVLRNDLTGELAVVMSVSGGLLDLRDKTGATARYKWGEHFSLAEHDQAVDFRAALREKRKADEAASGKKIKKRTPRAVASLLKRLTKKKR